MKKSYKWAFLILILCGAGYGVSIPVQKYLAQRGRINWRTDKVVQGDIKTVVNSTGTVKPRLQVAIGSFVSGPILELHAEFNQEVKEGDLLARIDPKLYQANWDRDRATFESRKADILRARAQLQQAINDEKRAIALRTEDSSFISQAEMDKFKFARLSLEAQLESAVTAAAQAKASMENSKANLDYTEIKAPIDGMIINKKIDSGQTVAASFQTPELFVIAPDMRKEMHIHANVDEADIGLIKKAQQHEYVVTFTVDAYPDDLFEGKVFEIRLSSTTNQNVVTYPVIVSAVNPELKLLPGMTASLSFQVDHRDDVVKIPNAALRYYPDSKHVVKEDQDILEGQRDRMLDRDDDQAQQNEKLISADERTLRRRERGRRHVWVQSGEKLRAVSVLTGLSDSHHTEMIEGDLKPGDLLVTGIRPAI